MSITKTELERVKTNIYDIIIDNIYGNLANSGLEVNDPQLRDAIVSALEEAATHFCMPEFGSTE